MKICMGFNFVGPNQLHIVSFLFLLTSLFALNYRLPNRENWPRRARHTRIAPAMVSKWFTNENDKTDRRLLPHISINDNIFPDIVVIRSKLLNLKLCTYIYTSTIEMLVQKISGWEFLRAIFINFHPHRFGWRLYLIHILNEHTMVDWQSCHFYKVFVIFLLKSFDEHCSKVRMTDCTTDGFFSLKKIKVRNFGYLKMAILDVASSKCNVAEQPVNWSNALSWIFFGFSIASSTLLSVCVTS